jgi:hypothetical protein
VNIPENDSGVLANDLEVGRGEIELVDRRARQLLEDGDQLGRVGVGQPAQEHAVDDGEDRGVGADAHGQRERGDDRETRIALQVAQRVSHVAAQQIEMLARRRRRDAAKRVPPQSDGPHRSSSRQRVTPLIGEGRGHVVAEVAAELRGKSRSRRRKIRSARDMSSLTRCFTD